MRSLRFALLVLVIALMAAALPATRRAAAQCQGCCEVLCWYDGTVVCWQDQDCGRGCCDTTDPSCWPPC